MKREKTVRMKKYVKCMGNAVSVLSILFVLSALVRVDFDVSAVTNWRAFLCICLIGVLLKTFTVFLSGSAWCLWLEFLARKKCDRTEALNVYAKANIGKYMPGNVMHYVERNLFAGKLELSQKQMAAASLFEVVSLVFTAFSMGMLLAFSQMKKALHTIFARWAIPLNLPILFGVCAGILCMLSLFLLSGIRTFAKTSVSEVRRMAKTFISCFLIYAAVLFILGFILVLAYWYWVQWPTCQQVRFLIAGYMIAWVLGFIIPGAPGGIGVRELALTLLLSPVVGKDIIVALGVLHRLITVLGDFAAYFVRKWL